MFACCSYSGNSQVIEVGTREQMCLEHVLNVDNVGAERMSSGRLFHTTGPATQNARLPSCSLVLGTTKSPRATERRAERLGTVECTCRISGVTRILTQGGGTTNIFTKAGIHHRNVYVKKYDKLAHLITHKMAWSFQRQAPVISIKWSCRNCQIVLHARAQGGGTCPSAP